MVGELHTHLSMCQAVIWSLREEIFEGRLPVLEIAAFLVVFGDLLVRPVVRREADMARRVALGLVVFADFTVSPGQGSEDRGGLVRVRRPNRRCGAWLSPSFSNQGGLGVRTVRAKLQEPLSVGTPAMPSEYSTTALRSCAL